MPIGHINVWRDNNFNKSVRFRRNSTLNIAKKFIKSKVAKHRKMETTIGRDYGRKDEQRRDVTTING